ncbi:putative bifunctional diguanylate cyclase/phosphodiesterase [Anaeromassilibacillus sp. SJQ-5]|jgi:hypothetical protein
MFDLMNEIPELVYVSDLENYDLLLVNTAGRETFHLKDSQGLKCYQALQGRDAPCPFCTNARLNTETPYTWEFTNPLTQRHYLLKDKLIRWKGRLARLEIAFDITETENKKIALQNALDGDKMIMECVQMLYQSEDVDSAINRVLDRVGSFMSADRAYLFAIQGERMANTHEWCAPGVEPQIQNLQDLDIRLLDRWRPSFNRQECVIIEDLEAIRDDSPDEYETLNIQGISSLVAVPLEKDGELTGYIGVDNPPAEKIANISPLLHTLRYFLMTSLRRAEDERQLVRLSYYDTLTGFYNRNRYIRDINRQAQADGSFGIAYLDVNGLKDINDYYGHDYGDQVLASCAQKIRDAFPTGDFYRIGGDEFVVLCRGLEEEAFLSVVKKLRGLFAAGGVCHAAVGCQWTEKTANIQQLITAADTMMYEDKKHFYRRNSQSNRYRHYNDDVLGLTVPGVLPKLLEEERFVIYFQPKKAFHDRTLIGAEALVRYRTPEGDVIPPDQFLPLLEESRLIRLVDYYVFDRCCAKIAAWREQGKTPVPLSVNFSRYTLAEPDLPDRLTASCDAYGVPPALLEIEITDSAQGPEGDDVSALIRTLREAGFAVSIDDFGVQYANLPLFTSVDFDVLKIDKGLVDNIVTNEKAQAMVRALAHVCQVMNIRTIAEGVETEEQFAMLKKLGFGAAQGYLFSRPIPMEEYEAAYMQPKVPDAASKGP